MKTNNMSQLILYQPTFPKRRIGRNNDGGYITVELPDGYDLFLSGGIAEDISFETHFLDLYPNISCKAFDGTISSLPKQDDRIQFIKKNIGNTNSETLTNLNEYIEPYKDIFMKIDIEGHEFRLFPSLLENNFIQKIKQLVLEIHSPADIKKVPDYYNGLSDVTEDKMFTILKQLNQTHTLVHFHGNNACGLNTIDGIPIPNVFELTYIRNDYITEKIQNTEPLPHKIDRPNLSHISDFTFNMFPYCNPA